ncbi:pYEATS domain-containing protein [Flavobacterium artemisiae]|uniref:PYEATS domain-containing protein n=1 Tax=Flavobacterium artemisiae TaxID=2126556 RepID=A0ABW4HAG3_9FLAO
MSNLENQSKHKWARFINKNKWEDDDDSEFVAEQIKKEIETEPSILIYFLLSLIVGLIGVIGFPLSNNGNGFSLVFIGILLGMSSLVCGFFTGTLFGMPKRNATDSSDYTLNNSLVEISEWLTKIIVGLGLVNLREIPEYLYNLGQFVKKDSNNQSYVDFYAMSILVYFSVLGLYVGYNYMRLVLSPKYKIVDDNMLKKIEQVTEKLKETKKENVKLQDEISIKSDAAQNLLKIVNKPDIPIEDIQVKSAEIANRPDVNETQSDITSYVNNMVNDAQEKLKIGLQTNPIDPQLGQWGGKAINNERELSASVTEISKGFYEIDLSVKSINNDNPLNSGEVILLALHDTFGDPPFRLLTVENGTAQVKLISYGSFTIGAYVDRGNTELELNLAALPNVSEYFKTH